MPNRSLCVAAAFLFSVLGIVPALAQQPRRIQVQPDLAGQWFRVRVVNQLDIPIYYKLVGGRNRAYAHATLQPGQSETDNATGGDKVLCVWDLHDHVLFAEPVLINRSGKIVIGGVAAAEAPAEGDARPKMAPRRMSVVPE